MKIPLSVKRERGLTLVELLVVVAILTVIAIMIIPPPRAEIRALRVQCLNNLKQDGLAARVWAGDNNGKFPWDLAQTNGGTMEFTSGTNLWRDFQILSNELAMPKVLLCPADDDSRAVAATNFTFLNNSNISFFLSLDATNGPSQIILSGDRNITNGTPVENGILKLSPNHAAGWTKEVHNKVGNILLADGSVQMLSTAGLQNSISNGSALTNRWLMPVLRLKE